MSSAPTCAKCRVREAIGACTRCKNVFYCSEKCQHDDEAIHARLCHYALGNSVPLGETDLEFSDADSLKERFHKTLLAHRLDAFQILALEVNENGDDHREAPGSSLFEYEQDAAEQFNENNGRSDANELLYFVDGETMDTEGDSLYSGFTSSTCKILPYGPSPGVYTISAPSNSFVDKDHKAHPPLKRAVILLLLSYWMDSQNQAKNKTRTMENIPYVRNVYTVNTGGRDAIFLDLDKPRSSLIELDDFLGVYNKRSDRAEALATELKIGTVDAQSYEWLQSLFEARRDEKSPFWSGPLGEAIDRIAKNVPSKERYTNQLAASMQRIIDIMPDIHHAWRGDITNVITNLITQVIHTLWMLQTNFECTLSNLTVSNIYLMPEPVKQRPQFFYQIGKASLSVPNLGFRVVLMNFEHATLTVRLRSGETSMIYSVITTKSIGRALAESLVPIEEIRSFSVQTSPTRFDPTRDIVTFFNSLSLEPRLGIHRHPVVTHFLAHEELSHVAAFGHNKLYRRVSLDQSPVVSVARKLKKSSWVDLTGESALAAFKIFRNILTIESNTINTASVMESKIASSFSVLYEVVHRYMQAKKNQKAGTSVSLLTFAFQEKALVARTLDAIGALRFYLLDPNNADVQMSWFQRLSESLSVIGDGLNIWATYKFADMRGWFSSLWTTTTIDPTTFKSSTTASETDVVKYLDELVDFFGTQSSDSKSAALSAAIRKAMGVLTKGESVSVLSLARLGRQTAARFIKAVVIQSGLDIAQYLLSRQLRFLLTRNVIMSGAAIPNVITFDRQRVAVTDMKKFIVDALNVGDNAKSPLRPRKPIVQGKIKRIIDNVPAFKRRLEAIRDEIDEKERKAKAAGKKETLSEDDEKARREINSFIEGERDPIGLVKASEIRRAAFTNPADLIKYFGDPTAVVNGSVITSELTRDKAMHFGGGAQGYVVGYKQVVGGRDDVIAVKMTNAMSDILSLRPTEMTSAAITTAAPINEAIVSSIASQLYEDGISPHFLRYEGCAVARVHGRDAFIGRTGYNPDELDNMVDEIVIDLLEHDNGMDVSTTITSVVNVMSVVLMEMVTALSISKLIPTVNNIQKLLTVLQQSVEKTTAGSAVAAIFKTARESLDSFFPENAPADGNDADIGDDMDYLSVVTEKLTGDKDGTVTLYDQLQMARLLDVRMLLKWISKQNPVMFLAAVDAIRRVIGLATAVVSGNFSGPLGDSFSGSHRPRGTAGESLKMFAAYKARGVSALPPRVRSHVEIWAKTMQVALDGSTLTNTTTTAPGIDKPADMFHVVSAMEAIDGDFNRFPDIVVAIQKALMAENGNVALHEIPTLDQYVDNAMAQVIFGLAQFQVHLGGMHMDFHTENMFVKLCDNTLFNGKPLVEYDYWEYRIGGKLFRVPNMGFLVKIGDLGHASLSLQRTNFDKVSTVNVAQEQTTSGKDYDGKNRLLVHKGTPAGIESLFGLDITPVRNLVNEVAELIPSVVPDGLNMADFANKIVSNLWLRQSGAFFPSYDLGHFMNACAMLPFAYRSKLVLEYHTTECMRWIATYGSLDGMPMYSPNAYMPFLAKFKHPIAEKQLTTPLDMINESLFLTSRHFVANEKA